MFSNENKTLDVIINESFFIVSRDLPEVEFLMEGKLDKIEPEFRNQCSFRINLIYNPLETLRNGNDEYLIDCPSLIKNGWGILAFSIAASIILIIIIISIFIGWKKWNQFKQEEVIEINQTTLITNEEQNGETKILYQKKRTPN